MTLLEAFQADCQLRGFAHAQIYAIYSQEFSEFLAARGLTPEQVDREALKSFLMALKSRGLKQSSQKRIFACLSAFYAFLVEEGVLEFNPIPAFRKRYVSSYKDRGSEPRQLISVDQAAMLVNSIMPSRDKAIVVLLLKTGMRLGELCRLDLGDVNLQDMSLVLKPTAKRSNRLLYFDHETVRALQVYLSLRRDLTPADPLFHSLRGRIGTHHVEHIVIDHATRAGLHDPASKDLSKRFTVHCTRHWLVTHLLRAGMSRDHVRWIRGDAMREAIDTYYHIDPEDVRKSYMACVPQLGV